jgi:hypothetical protein
MSRNDDIVVSLDEPSGVYQPGDTLTGSFSLSFGHSRDVLHAIEVSVLWYTEGKGDEDMGAHHFERLEAATLPEMGRRRRVSARLPASPLSYDGVLIKVRWCVRVRAFLESGEERLGEAAFQLGPGLRGRAAAADV